MKQKFQHTRRVAVSAVALAVAAGSLAGCSASGSDSGAVTLTWATPTDDSRMPAEQSVIDSCAAELDIEVKVDQIPFANYDAKLTTGMRAGNGPDVMRVNPLNTNAWATAGLLADLTPFVEDGSIETAELMPNLVEVGKVDGKIYSLPNDTDTRALFYNPALLESAGIVDENGAALPPATWADLTDAVSKFSGDTYGYTFRSDNDYSMAYEAVGPYAVQAGGEILTANSPIEAVAGSSEGTIAAVQLLQDIVETGAVPPGQETMSDSTMAQLFAAGKVAMMAGGPWVRAQLESANPEIQYGVDYATAIIPVQNAGDESGSTSGGWHNGVNAKSKNLDTAIAFLSCMEKPENLIAQAAATSFAPVTGALDSPPFSDDPFYDAFKELIPLSSPPITLVPEMAQVAASFQSHVLLAVVNGESVEDKLSEFDDEVNDQVLSK